MLFNITYKALVGVPARASALASHGSLACTNFAHNLDKYHA